MLNQQRGLNTLSKRMGIQEAKTLGPSLGEYYGAPLGLKNLHGYWPMSSHTQGYGDLVYDLSGQDRHLTRVGAELDSVAPFNNLAPYADYNGTTDYLTRADETGLDITGALTLWGWVWFDSIAGVRPLSGKWGAAAATRSYLLYTVGGVVTMALSTGAAVTTYAGTAVTTDGWHFLAGMYTPSATVDLFVDGETTSNATAVAALGNSASPFRIANDNDGNFLDGRTGPCGLQAAALGEDILQMLFQRGRPIWKI